MTDKMTVDEALEIIAESAHDIGPPFECNTMARVGKVLHDEIERLRELTRPVPVGERLPEEPRYQAFYPGAGWQEHRQSAMEAGQIQDGTWTAKIWGYTHWLPLPAEPEAKS